MSSKLLKEIRAKACLCCGQTPSDVAHIKTKKTGGTIEWANLLPLCRGHHILQHSKGFVWLAETFLNVKYALIQRGWEYDEYRKKWVREKV